jgi:hypothetical protein
MLVHGAFGFELQMDQVSTLKKDTSVGIELPFEDRQSVIIGFMGSSLDSGQVNTKMSLWGLTIRRYNSIAKGARFFYSFGVRSGRAVISDPIHLTEKESVVMPYYDLGIKSALNSRWTHMLSLEIGYMLLYTSVINIDNLIGIRISPTFSFGYAID